MSVKVFRSDIQPDSESAYQQWLNDNPDGFVVNALKRASGRNTKSDSRFTRIHRAKCKTINPLLCFSEKTGFTTGRYQKLCSTNLESADTAAHNITGLESIKKCPCFKHT